MPYSIFMLAAIAAADITPQVGTPLQGHFSAQPQSKGILAPLEVRTIVLRSGKMTVILITADIIGVTSEITRRIRQAIFDRHGVDRENILIAASHTHCGPAMLPCAGVAPQAEIIKRIEDAIITSVDRAMSELEPVTLGVGASAAHFNINRRPWPGETEMAANDAGVVDRRVRILRLDRPSGSPLAVLFHYSCHPTTKSGSDGLISPDYPGVACARIEKTLGCKAAFLPGCCGNIRPNIRDANGKFISATPEQLLALGCELADAVISATNFTRTFLDDRLTAAETPICFPFALMLPEKAIEQMSQDFNQPLHADWAARHLPMARQRAALTGETSIMQAIRIGPIVLMGIPGEPVQEIGYAIERKLVRQSMDVWPVGYANDLLGYFCTPPMYVQGGYEPTAYIVLNRPAAYQDEERIIVNTAANLIETI